MKIALRPLWLSVAVSLALLGTACNRSQTPESPYGIVVVNSPAAGQVRRVLVSEGAQVNAGTPIVEIVVEQTSAQTLPSSPGETAEGQAIRRVKTSEAEIEAARAEVIKHEAEVARLTPLVAAGEASQSQLDGERALYERAQQRLQNAQDAAKQAETGLLAARQPGAQEAAKPGQQQTVVREQVVYASATSPGTVSVISTRAGDRVNLGQPLATLRSDAR